MKVGKLASCNDECFADGRDCFLMIGPNGECSHHHVVKPVPPRQILLNALRETWPRPEEITDTTDFADFRGDWIATAAMLAIERRTR
jgi:hypothetical protein